MAIAQRYVSDRLTHFIGRGKPLEEQYRLLLKILSDGKLMHAPFDPTRQGNVAVKPARQVSGNEMVAPDCVCFCDIPMEDLPIHMAKYSRFGLAFEKNFVAARGGNPVYYVARDGRMPSGVQSRAEWFDRFASVWDQKILPILHSATRDTISHEEFMGFVWLIYRDLLGHLKFFDHTLSDDDVDNFYMEREWRIIGHMDFALQDVVTVILPRDYSARFRCDCPAYGNEVVFARAP